MPRGILGSGKLTRYQLEQRVNELEAQVANLKGDVKWRDKHIDRLDKQLTTAVHALARALKGSHDIPMIADMLRTLIERSQENNNDENG